MKKKVNMKKENKIKKILNSYHTILVFLIIIVVSLLIYNYYLMKSNKVYMFNGTGKYVTIYNGVVALNYDVNLLEGSDVFYIQEKDIIVTKYKIGYYVKVNEKLTPILIIEDNDEEGFSLRALLEGISSFNLNELNHNRIHFTKDVKKSLDNGLYFVIEATDKKGEKISDITEMNVTKLTK